MKEASLGAYRKRLRTLVAWICLVVILGVLVYQIPRLARNLGPLHKSDFIAFWVAGRLNIAGLNPYDPDQSFPLQKEVGWDKNKPNRLWNPPWALLFYMPFSFFTYPIARALWLILNLALVFFCADCLWRFYGGPAPYRWLAWVVGLFFYPTVIVLFAGQNGVLVLLGIVGFLHFIKNQKGWLAGICTILVAIKPHPAYLFGIALLFWVIDRRRWSVLLGMGFAGLVATVILLGVNPSVFTHYLHASANGPNFLFDFRTPTFGMLLRILLGLDKKWLQLIPPALGTIWFLLHWAKHRQTWEWGEQMPMLLLVSLVTTFYTWPHDQVVLLVAVMQVTVLIFRHNRGWMIFWIIMPYLGINSLPFIWLIPDDFWKIWMAPSFLFWYWMTCRMSVRRASIPF